MIHIAAGGTEYGKVMSLCTACAEQKLFTCCSQVWDAGSSKRAKQPRLADHTVLEMASNGGWVLGVHLYQELNHLLQPGPGHWVLRASKPLLLGRRLHCCTPPAAIVKPLGCLIRRSRPLPCEIPRVVLVVKGEP